MKLYEVNSVKQTFGSKEELPTREELEEKLVIAIQGEARIYYVESVEIRVSPFFTEVEYNVTPVTA